MTSGIQTSHIFKAIIHKDFDNVNLENDIALMMLETQIKLSVNILPICLPEPGIVLQGTGTVVGFGGTESDPSGSGVLREVNVKIVSDDECIEADADFSDNLNQGNFCAGNKGEVKNVCGGDSGKV